MCNTVSFHFKTLYCPISGGDCNDEAVSDYIWTDMFSDIELLCTLAWNGFIRNFLQLKQVILHLFRTHFSLTSVLNLLKRSSKRIAISCPANSNRLFP